MIFKLIYNLFALFCSLLFVIKLLIVPLIICVPYLLMFFII